MSMSIENAEPMLVAERVVLSDALGAIRVIATDTAVVAIYFADHGRARAFPTRPIAAGVRHGRVDHTTRAPEARHEVLDRAARELDEYVRGVRRSFSLPLAPGGTAFQRAVWDALVAIPFGETRSYAAIAAAIGRPRAARAVGAANALNPISVVVPCHRVIGSDRDLTGYAGGLARKRWLLNHEAPS